MNLKRLLLLINICLAGIAIWMASSIYLSWRSADEEKGLPPGRTVKSGSTVKESSGKPKTLKDYRIIVDRDIFDTAKKAPAKKQEKIAKVTKLDLKYIDNWSLGLGFKIMLKTCWVMVTGASN
jgi:hypothetical protein